MSIGCPKCRAYIGEIVANNLCCPHPDITCRDCGEHDARTYRSVQASNRRTAARITTTRPDVVCFLDDARGIYIPQSFAQAVPGMRACTISNSDMAILLAGPDHEHYWEAWDDVTSSVKVTGQDGVRYTIYQDGDCFLVPVGMEWSEEAGWFVWPDETAIEEG